MSGGDAVSAAVARAFRDERAIVLATLIRQVGDFQLAEEPPRGGARSIACAGTGRSRIAPSGWPS